MNFFLKDSHFWLKRYAQFTVICTLGLIFLGGLVKSHESGLSVPDWPNTYGEFMFTFPYSKWVGGIFYEHLHRLFASFVGFLILILSFWIWKIESRVWLKKLGFAALFTVILQGLLGGLTVIFLLPTLISMAHGILAQTFFCITIAISFYLTSKKTFNKNILSSHHSKFIKLVFLLTASVYVQLILGALMRHTNSGLAILDFPLSNGQLIPFPNENLLSSINYLRFDLGLNSVNLFQIISHLLHRIGAIIVFVINGILLVHTLKFHRRNDKFLIPVLFITLLIFTQIFLAAFVIWTRKSPLITTFHVWTGALILGSSFLLLLRSFNSYQINKTFFSFLFSKNNSKKKIKRSSMNLFYSFIELSKPRIMWLVVISTMLGYYLGSINNTLFLFNFSTILYTIIGTMCVCSGASILNQFLEKDLDKNMNRTKNRPLPSERIKPETARNFGTYISALGVIIFFISVDILVGFIAFLTIFLYVIIYTPLKMKTTLNTFIGAIPGALPPLGGWVSGTGKIEPGALILFSILFFWQIPHFYSIAWIHRKDYAKVGFKMLPIHNSNLKRTSFYCVFFTILLIISTSSLTWIGLTDKLFLYGSLLIGLIFLYFSIETFSKWTYKKAKRLLIVSILYLPVLLFILILDKSF